MNNSTLKTDGNNLPFPAAPALAASHPTEQKLIGGLQASVQSNVAAALGIPTDSVTPETTINYAQWHKVLENLTATYKWTLSLNLISPGAPVKISVGQIIEIIKKIANQ